MEKILLVKDLCYQIPYGEEILHNITFELGQGEFIGVLGKNGVGKSTIIDLIMGHRPVTSGEISIHGEKPMSSDRKFLNETVFISQNISLKANITIREQLDFMAYFYPRYSKDIETHLIEKFEVNPEAKIGSLSTGQRKRVQIIYALSALSKFLIVDEITAVLDPEGREKFFEALLEHKKNFGLSILLATNLVEDLKVRADQVLYMEKGEGKLYGPDKINQLFNLKHAA